MKTDKEILSEITNIVERWWMGRENDDEAMDKIAAILKENNMISRNYYDIINTSTKNEY
jgi:hypothetical protein